ncbi:MULTISPECIES: DUF5105 domain-containing protein [Carnobacterium]|uniref:DUF5105 domain-containing protein n=1 Tax=Carnobacterium TaxID=2747 RepID=UPI002891598D|nr:MULTISPECIES: DUF5105 domain-containing protein [Carnobacterium]MDT1939320.1 DUF5105 domain-containing protein [Carnobacterium divergens]MDT1941758.1 DUF5105 domain-containing protein [Carnobacterium divergens]MDT1947556.1 DUF5105 domain-containing protein [Carnobacterium divergens]MDT1949995.1 DUF5105 domain-containing protein [Carnobacterium divergens]MDT1955173.1 DUF5105 domain-containing protein [Carnobacterium divergens]
MKNRILPILAVLSISITLLAGCTKKIDSEDAISSYINAYIYSDETDTLQKAFAEKETDLAKEDKENFTSSLKEQFKLGDDYDPKLDELYQIYQTNLKKNTKFSTKILHEKSDKATVEVTVSGLKELNLDNLEEEISQKIAVNPDLINEDLSEEDAQKVINQLAFDIYSEKIKANTETKEPVKLSISLKENPDDKNAWVIQNENDIFKELSDAFGV